MKKFFYRVQENETITSISQKFNSPTGRLIFNNKLSKEVSAGDIIFVEQVKNVYLVKPADTIKSLAKRFNMPEQEILEKNHLPYLFCGIYIEV